MAKDRSFAYWNFGIVSYFLVLYLLYYFKIDSTIIGVLREIFTIPFFVLLLVFAPLSIIQYRRHYRNSTLLKISIFLLLICLALVIISFF